VRWGLGRPTELPERPEQYAEFMALPRDETALEKIERRRHAAPATPDDVAVLWDGSGSTHERL